VVDEWVCRFHPEGAVGATHIHGITDADVAGASRFAQVLPEISARLAGVAVAGHNVTFDLGFLLAEYPRAGWAHERSGLTRPHHMINTPAEPLQGMAH